MSETRSWRLVIKMKKWHELSILEVADLYRRQELSPVELVMNSFRRLEELEPKLNAFITTIESQAMEAAKQAETIFSKKEPTSLLCGIPYTVKDLFDTKGIRTTCGSRILQDHIPDSTAQLVGQLEACGAVLLGKTNMLEFAYGIVHPDYGQTNNPWDLTKTSGGSSGGSAAAVASGIGSFSLGSDTGGSIRIPASYCGISGLKPTFGLLSLEGVFPLSPSLDHAGPLARTSEDILVVMETLVPHFQTAESPKGTNLVAGILPAHAFNDVNEDVKLVYQQVLKEMEAMGWKLKETELASLQHAEEIVMNILLPEAAIIHEKWLGRKTDYAPLTFKQIVAGFVHRSVDYLKAKQASACVRQEIDHILEQAGILIMPTVPFPAPEEDPALEADNEMKFTGLFNISGHPAVTIQAGFSKENLPIGIQLIGRHGDDRSLLEKAMMLEKQFTKTVKGNQLNVHNS